MGSPYTTRVNPIGDYHGTDLTDRKILAAERQSIGATANRERASLPSVSTGGYV